MVSAREPDSEDVDSNRVPVVKGLEAADDVKGKPLFINPIKSRFLEPLVWKRVCFEDGYMLRENLIELLCNHAADSLVGNPERPATVRVSVLSNSNSLQAVKQVGRVNRLKVFLDATIEGLVNDGAEIGMRPEYNSVLPSPTVVSRTS